MLVQEEDLIIEKEMKLLRSAIAQPDNAVRPTTIFY
jgi:hypothetical protein